MAEIKKLLHLSSEPGIRRDGTDIDGNHYSDGQWVRFRRGRPEKMGGFLTIQGIFNGPSRSMFSWSNGNLHNIYSFSGYGVEMIQIDKNGLGSVVIDKSPSGFTINDNHLWSTSTMFDAAVGSDKTVVLGLCAPSGEYIDDRTEGQLMIGDVLSTSAFTYVADSNATASGGVFCTAPYAVLYGNDGKVTWSNQNEPQNYTTGDAGSARVTGSKIVKGLPMRGSSGPGGMLWSLDSVVRMDYIGGPSVFKFSTVSGMSSILAQNSVIEYDGYYFWIGIDRFLMSDGNSVKEIPNPMNQDWFFDGLNYDHRQKVWVMKITRFGEIWWFYPRGNSEECSHAVIYNLREQSWYDVELARSSGYYSQVMANPVMSDSSPIPYFQIIDHTTSSGSFSIGDTVRGVTTGTTGTIVEKFSTVSYIRVTTNDQYITGESLIGDSGTGVVTSVTFGYSLFLHEKGLDNVSYSSQTAIRSRIVSNNIGFPVTSDPSNFWTRLVRVEPDIKQTGPVTMKIHTKEYPNSEDVVSTISTIDEITEKVDLRIQGRILSVEFESNVLGGDFSLGKSIIHLEQGDIRS